MKDKLGSASIVAFIVHAMMGIRIITLPRDAVIYAKNDAWISIIVVGILAFINGYFAFYICQKYPGLNYSEIGERVLGKFLGKLLMIVYAINIAIALSLDLRIFAESISIFLLDRTPVNVIVLLMLSACLYCVSKGIKTISIVLDLILPILLLFLALLLILPLKAADIRNLMPVFHGGIIPIIKGSLNIMDPIVSILGLTFMMPYISDQKSAKKWIYIAIAIVTVYYLVVVIMCLSVFGYEELNYLIFPTLTLTKSIQIRGQVFERAESLFMAAWIPNSFTTMIIYYYILTLNFKKLLNLKKDRLIIYSEAVLFFAVTFIPRNIVQAFNLVKINTYIAQFVLLFSNPALVLAAKLKTGGKNKNET
jgi:spore germination protein (amino acid permease)